MNQFYVIIYSMERLIALDTETTGLDPKEGHRIIEIGAVEIININETGAAFHKYIHSGQQVGESFKVHGISNDYLRRNGKDFKEIFDDFITFIKDATLVIHNAPFDLAFLNNEFKLIGIKDQIESFCNKDKPIIDTLELHIEEFGREKRHSLDALCRQYGIDDSSRTKHGALIDSKILAFVYSAMITGQETMFDEDINIEVIKTSPSLEKKIIENKDNIKVIYANDKEIKLHEKYFNN